MIRISHKAAAERAIHTRLSRALQAGGVVLKESIKQQLSKSGSTRKGGNTPSAPGQPPAVQTGHLRRSIQMDASRAQGRDPRVRVGTNVKYARIHEYGGTISHPGGTAYFVKDGRAVFVSNAKATAGMKRTKPHSIRIPKRPYMRPGYLTARARMSRAVQFQLRGVR